MRQVLFVNFPLTKGESGLWKYDKMRKGITFAIIALNSFSMQKRILGFVLLSLGLAGMALSGYIFVTGSGGRGHLVEVTSYMILGAACFFWGINLLYASANVFTEEHLQITPELDEVSPIQQQWRTIHIAKQPASHVSQAVNKISAEAV